MHLSDKHKNALLLNLNKSVEDSADYTVNELLRGKAEELISYPPNGGFTPKELEALERLKGNESLRSALRKIIANANGSILFDFFNLLDGTSDPEIDSGEWEGVMLVDLSEEYAPESMLHDDFFESYWDWVEQRESPEERLDLP